MAGLRRKRVSEAKRQQIREMLDKGTPVGAIAPRMGVSRSVVYKIRKLPRGVPAQPEQQAGGGLAT